MTVETSTYISELNASYPEAGSAFQEGDDHIRKLKANIKATFPNFTAIAITPTSVELNYVDGVTSSIQTQLDAKAPIASPTFTGTVVLPSTTSIANVSATEIAYLDGVTSAIQTQIDTKAPIASPTFTGTVTIPGGASISGFAPLASPTFTGTPAAPTASPGTTTTQIATTAFVVAQGLSSALPGQSGSAGKYVKTDGSTASWADPYASAPLTGTPTAPTAAGGTNTTQIATTAFVVAGFAPLASPTLTGTPIAPTAAVGTDTTQIATTAFARAVAGGYAAEAIGTYVFGKVSSAGTVAFGSTVAGSSINPTSILYAGSGNNNSTGLAGTWRVMGYLANGSNECTLFLRIS